MLVCYFSSAGKLEPKLALVMSLGQVGRSGLDAASRLGLAKLRTAQNIYKGEWGNVPAGERLGKGMRVFRVSGRTKRADWASDIVRISNRLRVLVELVDLRYFVISADLLLVSASVCSVSIFTEYSIILIFVTQSSLSHPASGSRPSK